MKYYLTQFARCFFTPFGGFILPLIAWFIYGWLSLSGVISTHISPNIVFGAGMITLLIGTLILIWVILGVKGLNIRTIDHRRKDQQNKHFDLTTKLSLTFLVISTLTLTPILTALYNLMAQSYQAIQSGQKYSVLAAWALLFTCSPINFALLASLFTQLFPDEEKLQASRKSDLPIWRSVWNEAFPPLWLLFTNSTEKEQYNLHGHWRVQAYFTLLYRRWQYFDLKRGLSQQRWLWILIAAALSLLLGKYFIHYFDEWMGLKLQTALSGSNAGAQAANIILFILSAGVLFVIWVFRDQNARWQIENARKDVNLKDFQRISEWAAGMHLPEDKLIEISKTTDANDPKDKRQESSTSIETSLSPKKQHALSRREGGESLQIAAIYQMASFLNGDFGTHFQRPAFRLLTSIYQNLYPESLETFQQATLYTETFSGKTPLTSDTAQKFRNRVNKWRTKTVRPKAQEGIITALDATLFNQHGRVLRQHLGDLPGLILHYADTCRSMLTQPIELMSLNLSGLQAIGADLTEAQLQGADLTEAQLQGADLFKAQLQGADLTEAQLQGADLFSAQLQGANLRGANLQGANLRGANLQGADLFKAQLQGADLRDANLQGADLKGANLQGALVLNGSWDTHTDLRGSDLSQTIIAVGELGWFDDIFTLDRKKTSQLHQQLSAQGATIDERAIPADMDYFNFKTRTWLKSKPEPS